MTVDYNAARQRSEDIIDMMDRLLEFIVEEKEFPLKAMAEMKKEAFDREFNLILVTLIDTVNTNETIKNKRIKDSLKNVEEVVKYNIAVISEIKKNPRFTQISKKYKNMGVDLNDFENTNLVCLRSELYDQFHITGEGHKDSGTIDNLGFQRFLFYQSRKIKQRFNIGSHLGKRGFTRIITNRFDVSANLIELFNKEQKIKEENTLIKSLSKNEQMKKIGKIISDVRSRYASSQHVDNIIKDKKLMDVYYDVPETKRELYTNWKESYGEYGLLKKGSAYRVFAIEKMNDTNLILNREKDLEGICVEATLELNAFLNENFSTAIPQKDSFSVKKRQYEIFQNIKDYTKNKSTKKEFLKSIMKDITNYTSGYLYGSIVADISGMKLGTNQNKEFNPIDLANNTNNESTIKEVKNIMIEAVNSISINESYKNMIIEILKDIEQEYDLEILDKTTNKIEGYKVETLIFDSILEGIGINSSKDYDTFLSSPLKLGELTEESRHGLKDAYVDKMKEVKGNWLDYKSNNYFSRIERTFERDTNNIENWGTRLNRFNSKEHEIENELRATL